MTIKEQQLTKTKNYTEALRYMDNAKEVLKKAVKDDAYYKDKKYVRMACGTAYNGVLLALDAWFELKDIEFPKQKSHKTIRFYKENLARKDRKMLNYLDTVYEILHQAGYYEGILDSRVLKIGFDTAYEIIKKLSLHNYHLNTN